MLRPAYNDVATNNENAIALRLLTPNSFTASMLQVALGRSTTHLVATLTPREKLTLLRSRARVVSIASVGSREDYGLIC